MALDERRWKAMARLASSPEGKELRAYLEERLAECRDSLEQIPEGSEISKAQGRAKELRHLIERLDRSSEVIRTRYN